jgi:hypothetical protein
MDWWRSTEIGPPAPERLAAGLITPGPAPSVLPSGVRGIRNNNPGNLRDTGEAWNGKVGADKDGFMRFDRPEAGIRALGKNLLGYQDKYDVRTLGGIISKWAPNSENDTASYIADAAKQTGLDPSAKIDLHDPATLRKVSEAIIKHENGSMPYTGDQMSTGLRAAADGSRLPSVKAWAAPYASVDDPWRAPMPEARSDRGAGLGDGKLKVEAIVTVRDSLGRPRNDVDVAVSDATYHSMADGR